MKSLCVVNWAQAQALPHGYFTFKISQTPEALGKVRPGDFVKHILVRGKI